MLNIIVLLLQTTFILAREPKQVTLVNQGTISGMYITRFRTKRVAAYVGVPYAQPPVEFRRFAAPEIANLPQWEGVRNATIFAPDCMQRVLKKEDLQNPLKKHDELFMKLLESQMEEPREKEYSEDCLYLNVYVPDGE
ncbi:liver carboxylesterase 4-like [Bombyx mandarina]|uniref:Liver carboxylesterase 4-like n=1 Tax=Bombyx mandarina TaxID=7092 RepID=A0A6J2KMJ8_BOMMA|nr:liver carboxylesterase 4-like [Bombyx mandarina]